MGSSIPSPSINSDCRSIYIQRANHHDKKFKIPAVELPTQLQQKHAKAHHLMVGAFLVVVGTRIAREWRVWVEERGVYILSRHPILLAPDECEGRLFWDCRVVVMILTAIIRWKNRKYGLICGNVGFGDFRMQWYECSLTE